MFLTLRILPWLLVAFVATGCQRSGKPDATARKRDQVARAFRGVEVNGSELEDAVRLCLATRVQAGQPVPEEGRHALSVRVAEALLTERLLLAEIPAGAKDLETETDLQIADLARAFGDGGTLMNSLAPLGWDEPRLRAGIKSMLRIRKLLATKLPTLTPPPPAEIAEFYSENAALFFQKPKAQVRHILLSVPLDATPEQRAAQREACEAARRRIVAGEAFDTVAAAVSQDAATASQGGNLGLVSLGVVVPEFEEVAASTPVGQLSPVFETRFGWHVLQVTGLAPARVVPLAEARSVIERILMDRTALQSIRTHLTQYLQQNGAEFFLDEPR